MSDAVLYEVRGRTALITLNRPERLNAWNDDLAKGYFNSLDTAAADSNVRAIVVTGAGRGFCAGADMDVLQGIESGSNDDGGEPDRRDATYAMGIPKPIIAAVNGACAGLGLVHALACDVRFAAEGAKFTVAFSRRGLIAEHGLSWTMPRLVGQSVALDLIMSGRVFLSDEAKELGVVNRVCAPDALIDEAMAYADDLAANVSPTSMAVMKHQIYNHPMMPLSEAMVESNRFMHESLRRPDFKEGVSSFVEKRPPNFAPYSSESD
ncbi:MAG: enoyl-CoA hydratase [Actinomycetia bacterium]|nr:enoyl-CoA hydratase [Actinomycetes bacterium]